MAIFANLNNATRVEKENGSKKKFPMATTASRMKRIEIAWKEKMRSLNIVLIKSFKLSD